MSTIEQQILSLVDTLSHAERLRIMHAILRTLENREEPLVPTVDPTHLEIAEKRAREFDQGQAKVISREVFWENLKKRRGGL